MADINTTINRILIIYHRVDYDGLGSMAITKSALKSYTPNPIDTFGYNYNDPIPDFNNYLSVYDAIFLVDISFPAEDMKILKDSGKVVWIDHHITQITESKELGYSDMEGIREDGTAACELCWRYFNPGKEVPLPVLYLSHYDTWRHDVFSWDKEILPFQYGLRAKYSLNAHLFSQEFDDILKNYEELIISGTGVLRYLNGTWKGCVKGYAFDVTVADKYKGVCMLTSTFGSTQFDSVKDQYDVYICVNRKDSNCYNFSMYVNDNCDFNAGELMKSKYSGGGHCRSAGGILTLEQFIHLVRDCKIDGV